MQLTLDRDRPHAGSRRRASEMSNRRLRCAPRHLDGGGFGGSCLAAPSGKPRKPVEPDRGARSGRRPHRSGRDPSANDAWAPSCHPLPLRARLDDQRPAPWSTSRGASRRPSRQRLEGGAHLVALRSRSYNGSTGFDVDAIDLHRRPRSPPENSIADPPRASRLEAEVDCELLSRINPLEPVSSRSRYGPFIDADPDRGRRVQRGR